MGKFIGLGPAPSVQRLSTDDAVELRMSLRGGIKSLAKVYRAAVAHGTAAVLIPSGHRLFFNLIGETKQIRPKAATSIDMPQF